MTAKNNSRLLQIIKKYEAELLKDWLEEIDRTSSPQHGLMKEGELKEQCPTFVRLLQKAFAESDNLSNVDAKNWGEVHELLANISRSRSIQGMIPSETATFVFSFKEKTSAVMLDLNMPEMDGFSVLKSIRQNPATASLPVIIHSGKTLSVEQRKQLEQNAVVLEKDSSDESVFHRNLRHALEQAGLISSIR